jgi:hypothetical protein
MKKRSKHLTKEPDLMDVLKNPTDDFLVELTNVKNEHLHILRGHLLIEKKLRELMYLKVEKPDTLAEARLSFNQILCITEALYWEKESEWLWESIRKLNNIRNSFSHQLTPKKYANAITEFLSIYKPDEFGQGARIMLVMYAIYRKLNEYVVASTNSKVNNTKK